MHPVPHKLHFSCSERVGKTGRNQTPCLRPKPCGPFYLFNNHKSTTAWWQCVSEASVEDEYIYIHPCHVKGLVTLFVNMKLKFHWFLLGGLSSMCEGYENPSWWSLVKSKTIYILWEELGHPLHPHLALTV